ncbi:hypothetical protein ACI7YT_11210 [Microbacterium sp. M]|uniref:hypothetical protein n=1 Tax=Microbacterium sp. M TaxID=3377125 RepID=UPI0038634438
MNFSCTRHLRLTAIGIVALAAGSLVACSPEPEPTPTPTAAFASEEEAFAAAEEVYRAYIAAFNEVDLSDPSTFEPLSEYTTGRYQSDEREQLSEMHANGNIRGGEIVVVSFAGTKVLTPDQIKTRTCEDVSETTFTDSAGRNLVPADRAPRYALDLTFQVTGGDLKLVSSEPVEDPACTG